MAIVGFQSLELNGPASILEGLDLGNALSLSRAPAADAVRRLVAVGERFFGDAGDVGAVEPVVAGVIDYHVEHNEHAPIVGVVDQIPKILERTETGVNFEEILDCVAVVSLEIRALLKDGVEPKAGDSQPLEVIKLALDAAECSTVEAQTRPHPGGLVGRPIPFGVRAVVERTLRFKAVAEPIRQDLVENMVLPQRWTGKHAPAWLQVQLRDGGWPYFFNNRSGFHELF